MKKAKFICLFSALLMLCSCNSQDNSNYCTVNFDTNTTLNASTPSTQKVYKGGKIKKPSSQVIGSNPDNYQVYAWYKEKECLNEWNFKKDTTESSMTLFAKWEKKFTVKYFVGDSLAPTNTVSVFNGLTVKEHAEYCVGYEYLGSYSDPEFTTLFDYNAPITKNTSIYMKKSDALCLYEGNAAGSLFDNLEIHAATDNKGEIGSVSKTEDKSAISVNFGYSPASPDPFVELAINVDITKSPIINFKVRNIGDAENMSFYYTTITDLSNYTYSATGSDYTEAFSEKYVYTQEDFQKMKNGESIVISIDFANPSSGLFHGYSVWGTSTHLGKMRIQSTYKSKNYEDRSNIVIFEKIWGSNEGYEEGVKTEDSQAVKDICKDSTSLPTQTDNANGFIFPKDNKYAVSSDTCDIYKRDDGLLAHFKNEVEMRNEVNKYQSFSIELPMEHGDVVGDKIISLDTYKTVYITLKNLSYVDSVSIGVSNDYGGTVYSTLKLPTRMAEPRTFIINLSKENTMAHTLTKINFELIASGVDNALLIKDITFGEAKPADIVGIDFDDKNCFGLSGTGVDVKYSSSSSSVEFNVSNSGATVTSSKTDIKLTNKGYYKLVLTYTRVRDSQIDKIFVSFYDGSKYSDEVEFELNKTLTTINSITKDLDPSQTANIRNIKFRFEGTGKVRIRSVRFGVDDASCLNLSNDFSNAYDQTWIKNVSYSYDSSIEASTINVNPTVVGEKNASFYLGPGHKSFPNAYNCCNLNCEGKSKIIIVYHNENSTASCTMIPAFAYGPNDITDLVTGINNSRQIAVSFSGNMSEYEWKYVELSIPSELQSMYLGKISFRNLSGTVSFRLISVI